MLSGWFRKVAAFSSNKPKAYVKDPIKHIGIYAVKCPRVERVNYTALKAKNALFKNAG